MQRLERGLAIVGCAWECKGGDRLESLWAMLGSMGEEDIGARDAQMHGGEARLGGDSWNHYGLHMGVQWWISTAAGGHGEEINWKGCPGCRERRSTRVIAWEREDRPEVCGLGGGQSDVRQV